MLMHIYNSTHYVHYCSRVFVIFENLRLMKFVLNLIGVLEIENDYRTYTLT